MTVPGVASGGASGRRRLQDGHRENRPAEAVEDETGNFFPFWIRHAHGPTSRGGVCLASNPPAGHRQPCNLSIANFSLTAPPWTSRRIEKREPLRGKCAGARPLLEKNRRTGLNDLRRTVDELRRPASPPSAPASPRRLPRGPHPAHAPRPAARRPRPLRPPASSCARGRARGAAGLSRLASSVVGAGGVRVSGGGVAWPARRGCGARDGPADGDVVEAGNLRGGGRVRHGACAGEGGVLGRVRGDEGLLPAVEASARPSEPS